MPVSSASRTLPASLIPLERAYLSDVGIYVDRVRPYWSEKLGTGGTLTNLESGMSWMLTLGNSSLDSGCVSMQSETLRVLKKHKPPGWEVRPVVIGSGMEHHAVAVYETGKKLADSYIFDPWVEQKPMIFKFKEWVDRFPHYKHISPARFE